MAKVCRRRHRWVLDFYDQEGTRCWKTMPKGTTKDDANEELAKMVKQVRRQAYRSPKDIPLLKTVAEDWLAYKKQKIRISTWEVYEGHTKKHFTEFDDIRMDLISAQDVEGFISKYQQQGKPIATIRKVLVTLNQIFNYALRHGYIEQNPLQVAERPSESTQERKEKKAKRKQMQILTPKQIQAFLKAEKDAEYHALFMVAVFTGLRQGELLGLKWSDIDWEAKQVHVQRTFNKGRFFDTKTLESERRVDLGPKMISELKKWKLACPATELNLVFPNSAGGPINSHNMVNRFFKPALKAAKLPMIRFHDIRHTYASLLIEQGENVKYIQNQLGHSNPTVTLNVYAHLIKPSNQKAACKLEETVLVGE